MILDFESNKMGLTESKESITVGQEKTKVNHANIYVNEACCHELHFNKSSESICDICHNNNSLISWIHNNSQRKLCMNCIYEKIKN